MSPKEKHIPDDAQRTSVCLTGEERAAIGWLKQYRRREKEEEKRKRTTINDILVDCLWDHMERVHGKKKEHFTALLPPMPIPAPAKIAQMPKPKKKS